MWAGLKQNMEFIQVRAWTRASQWFFMQAESGHVKAGSQEPIDTPNQVLGALSAILLVGWCTYPPNKILGALFVILLNQRNMFEPMQIYTGHKQISSTF